MAADTSTSMKGENDCRESVLEDNDTPKSLPEGFVFVNLKQEEEFEDESIDTSEFCEQKLDEKIESYKFEIKIENLDNSDEDSKSNVNPIAQDESTLIKIARDTHTCPICNKHFSNSSNAVRHYSIHSENRFQCPKCPKKYVLKEQLEKHVIGHDTPPLKCEECGEDFEDPSDLVKHLEDNPNLSECQKCHAKFCTKEGFSKHRRQRKCGTNNDIYSCDFCSKTFSRNRSLQSHLQKHTTEKPFACDLCGVKFKHKSTKNKHMQWHQVEKPYACEVCGKKFAHPTLMKPHMRVHNGEKPFFCPTCNMRFAHKHNMQRHMEIHKRQKKILTCEICKKIFPKESTLIYHMRTHLNIKSFSCHICSKTFSHKQNIVRHYQRKHPTQTYVGTDTDAQVAIRVWESLKHVFGDERDEILG